MAKSIILKASFLLVYSPKVIVPRQILLTFKSEDPNFYKSMTLNFNSTYDEHPFNIILVNFFISDVCSSMSFKPETKQLFQPEENLFPELQQLQHHALVSILMQTETLKIFQVKYFLIYQLL